MIFAVCRVHLILPDYGYSMIFSTNLYLLFSYLISFFSFLILSNLFDERRHILALLWYIQTNYYVNQLRRGRKAITCISFIDLITIDVGQQSRSSTPSTVTSRVLCKSSLILVHTFSLGLFSTSARGKSISWWWWSTLSQVMVIVSTLWRSWQQTLLAFYFFFLTSSANCLFACGIYCCDFPYLKVITNMTKHSTETITTIKNSGRRGYIVHDASHVVHTRNLGAPAWHMSLTFYNIRVA